MSATASRRRRIPQSYNAYTSQLYQQAVTEGVSVFASSGDEGGDSSDADLSLGQRRPFRQRPDLYCPTTFRWEARTSRIRITPSVRPRRVRAAASVSTYWSPPIRRTLARHLSYIPEIPWNDSCGSQLWDTYNGYSTGYGTAGYCNNGGAKSVIAGSGGFSNCFTGAPDPNYPGIYSGTCTGNPKPSWQAGILGNPSDGVRDIPDVSLFASQGQWGHAFVYCTASCPTRLGLAGGTSFSSPIMSGIQALVNQYTGQNWGNPNPIYYAIANAQFTNGLFSGSLRFCDSSITGGPDGRCVFHDVTQGDIDLACPTGTQNCYNTGGAYGVLSNETPTTLDLLALETIPFPGGTIVSSPGSGYTSAPTCTLSGGGGAGATCTATASTAVGSVSLTSGGSGYTSTPTCAITSGGGSGATCTARERSGVVTSVTLTAGGSGYTSNPTCTISGGGGSGATCSALADGVGTITLTSAGSGYTAPPDCSLTGGGGSGATCGAFLGATSFQSAYAAGSGWDFATGLGTVNAYNLVMSSFWTP